MKQPHNIQKETPPLFEEVLSFETSRLQMNEQSMRRAWRVAACLGITLVLSWLALVLLLPLKRIEPYVIRVDRATGVADIVTTLHEKDVSADESLNKYFLSKYVRARETYDWNTLQTDYDETRLLSSVDAFNEYAAQFEGENALQETYGSKIKALVEVHSIVPTSERTGTVRFRKHIKRIDDAGDGIYTQWVATISFEYGAPEDMSESERLINPLGFHVTSYRVDPELLGETGGN